MSAGDDFWLATSCFSLSTSPVSCSTFCSRVGAAWAGAPINAAMATAANVLSLNFAVVSACAAVVTDFCRLQLLMVANLSLVMWIELAGYPSGSRLLAGLRFENKNYLVRISFPLLVWRRT